MIPTSTATAAALRGLSRLIEKPEGEPVDVFPEVERVHPAPIFNVTINFVSAKEEEPWPPMH